MQQFQLLVLDDDSLIGGTLKVSINDTWNLNFYNLAKNIPLEKNFDAALIDMHLSSDLNKAEGLNFIKKLHAKDPHLEIIAMSGDLTFNLMEDVLRAGANRYLAKPLNMNEINLTLNKIENLILLKNATSRGRNLHLWIGKSKDSEKIRKQIASYTEEWSPILIEGESGVGKEVVAQLLHHTRPKENFVSVNVAAISENLFESEFFGHIKGAFTGASQNKIGLAEAAHKGNLFLDEIETLSLNMQAKLLRFLESGEIRRVGSHQSIQIKCRLIAATNKNLEKMVKENLFREDLFWRLKGYKIDIPPLRDRPEDIPDLLKYFLSKDINRQKFFSEEALTYLKSYSWPGNVRELKQFCQKALATAPLPHIRKEDALNLLSNESSTDLSKRGYLGEEIDFSQGLTNILNQYESHAIKTCLEDKNDIDEVARILKISRSSLYKKIKDHNINWRN